MSFEEKVVRIREEAGWSDHILLGILLDYFWITKSGKTVKANVLKHLAKIKDDFLASKKAIEKGIT